MGFKPFHKTSTSNNNSIHKEKKPRGLSNGIPVSVNGFCEELDSVRQYGERYDSALLLLVGPAMVASGAGNTLISQHQHPVVKIPGNYKENRTRRAQYRAINTSTPGI